MNSKFLDLNYILNLDEFQKLQDDISNVVGFGVITVDYKGIPVTKHSKSCEFCQRIRKDPEYGQYCEKSDSRGGLEAARLRKPYIYLCHMGLVDFAIPIIVEDNYLGAVLGGQICIDREEEKNKLERVYSDRGHLGILDNDTELSELYNARPKFSLERIETVANLILHFTNYIVEEAIIKASWDDLNQKMSRMVKAEDVEFLNNVQNYNGHNENGLFQLQRRDKIINHEDKYVDARCIRYYKENYYGNKLLKPAVDYIHQNPREKIYIDKMATMCNISVSYFSRLFKKELNETFSRYVNNVKINEGKELLEITKLQISEIAFNLGYEDCGYFIKLFKKHVGETPASYRKEYITRKIEKISSI